MKTKIIIYILFLSLIVPVAVKGQEGEPAPAKQRDYATIWFYRKPEFYNGRFACWVDEVKLVSEFRSASYFWLNLPPGTYEIRTDGRPAWAIYEKKYQLKVEAGQQYYVEAGVDYDFLGTALFLNERSKTEFNQIQSKLTFDARANRTLD
ncbi:MAG: DUF2846 domain-containing protein [Bacteroidota bacterium]